jgi:hypothetical protein
MQEKLEKMEEIVRRLNVSYHEASEALEEAEGDLAEALVIAERARDTAAGGLAAAGIAFLDELKALISRGDFRALRIRFGNRLLKEIPVSPNTALATLGIAVAALLITKLRIEVDQRPASETQATPILGESTEESHSGP